MTQSGPIFLCAIHFVDRAAVATCGGDRITQKISTLMGEILELAVHDGYDGYMLLYYFYIVQLFLCACMHLVYKQAFKKRSISVLIVQNDTEDASSHNTFEK